jgi:hypothetical protein
MNYTLMSASFFSLGAKRIFGNRPEQKDQQGSPTMPIIGYAVQTKPAPLRPGDRVRPRAPLGAPPRPNFVTPPACGRIFFNSARRGACWNARGGRGPRDGALPSDCCSGVSMRSGGWHRVHLLIGELATRVSFTGEMPMPPLL